jgi:hypothetical protein
LLAKTYRDSFSSSYKLLLNRTDSKEYLPEILDSAQEAFPHMWVNCEKYIFSENVVESGK